MIQIGVLYGKLWIAMAATTLLPSWIVAIVRFIKEVQELVPYTHASIDEMVPEGW
jgi:hypothetical protein